LDGLRPISGGGSYSSIQLGIGGRIFDKNKLK